ncbi:MAG: mannitol dehydrogenase family protein, partial [Saccharothrix sp.]|nr:mannitol dehydrogenase family protein [Saccharothrix sp.]
MSAARLPRWLAADLPDAAVGVVHLGLGAFHRSHQAWYTAKAGDGWGIAAYTGRRP